MYLSDQRAESDVYAKLLRALNTNEEPVYSSFTLGLISILELIVVILVASAGLGGGAYLFNKAYLQKDDDKSLRK